MDDHGGENWVRGKVIGKGSFATVFLASLKEEPEKGLAHLPFPPLMAVKSAQVSASATLQQEKQVFDQIRGCPYIIRCFGEEITSNGKGEMNYNLLLEYASGGTLYKLIKKSRAGLLESDVKRHTKSILRGIYHIHEKGFVHCDLKPENILLVSKGGNLFAKIGDLGLAKQRKNSISDNSMRGTAPYMAPETVIQNIQDPSSDIWALGCVVCEMLTGKKSVWGWEKGMAREDYWRLIRDENELPKIPTWVSKDARSFLKACLVRNPMYRFTAEMLLDHPYLNEVDEFDYSAEEKSLGIDEDVLWGKSADMPICLGSSDGSNPVSYSTSWSSSSSSSSSDDSEIYLLRKPVEAHPGLLARLPPPPPPTIPAGG